MSTKIMANYKYCIMEVLGAKSGADFRDANASLTLYSLRPVTFPRKTVIEAFGSVNVVWGPASRVVAIGG